MNMTVYETSALNGIGYPAHVNPAHAGNVGVDADSRHLFLFFKIQIFSLIFLQKFAVPNPVAPLSLPLIILLSSFAVMALFSQIRFSAIRLFIFFMLLASSSLSQFMTDSPISIGSYLVFLALYISFTVEWPVSWDFYHKVLDTYLSAMILASIMVFIQLGWEFWFGFGNTLSIESFVPKSVLLPGYLYEGPIRWGSDFVRPNGFFFLEPSFASAFLACATVIELYYFRRLWWVALYGGAVVACMGGTGVVMLALAAPFFLVKFLSKKPPEVALLAIAAVAVTLAIVVSSGVLDPFTSRVDELNYSNSSGAARIVQPALQLVGLIYRDGFVITGAGAGNVNDAFASSWPVVKIYWEYGFITMLLYMTLFILSIMVSPCWGLKVALFVIFHFTGGYALGPTMVELVALLCTMIVPSQAGSPSVLTGPIEVPPSNKRPCN
jgi:hypothetical protein